MILKTVSLIYQELIHLLRVDFSGWTHDLFNLIILVPSYFESDIESFRSYFNLFVGLVLKIKYLKREFRI